MCLLGDASSLPTSKTGAAVRKQALVLVANLLSAMRGQPLAARYDGYTPARPVTSWNRMLLAEFDYDLKPRPSFPLINTMKPCYDMWLLKRYGPAGDVTCTPCCTAASQSWRRLPAGAWCGASPAQALRSGGSGAAITGRGTARG